MSQHHHLLEMYKPGINTEMAYPVDAGNLTTLQTAGHSSLGLVATLPQ